MTFCCTVHGTVKPEIDYFTVTAMCHVPRVTVSVPLVYPCYRFSINLAALSCAQVLEAGDDNGGSPPDGYEVRTFQIGRALS